MLHNAIGREVRAFRTRHGMKVSDLAAASNVSVGMLSKIEKGGISPSLTTLQAISRGLAVPISWLVSRFEADRTSVFVRAGTHCDIAPDGSIESQKPLGYVGVNSTGLLVEPCLLSLVHGTDIFPAFCHQGMVFLYMLQGEVIYRHGSSQYRMTAGDSLFFDAATQHGADELVELPVRCLSIMTRRQDRRYETLMPKS